MESFEVSRRYVDHLILTGKAKDAVVLLRQSTANPKNLTLLYFLLLAKAEHYADNQTATIDIYRYAIKNFSSDLAYIYNEMIVCAPEMEELFDVIRKLVETEDDESIYGLLSIPLPGLSTTKQLSFYEQRFLFICELLEQKNIPITSLGRAYMLLAHSFLLDKHLDDLPVRKKLAALCEKNMEGLVVQNFVKATPKERIKVGICITRYDSMDFQTIIGSLFQSFDSSKFELIFFAATQFKKKANLRIFHRIFHKVIFYDGNDCGQLRDLMIQEKLDVLLSENIAQAAPTFIFFSRVAPVQCNIFDRLISFGAPCVDYYIFWGEKNEYKDWSGTILEHEKYAILEDIYLCPAPNRAIATPWDLTELGLPEGAPFLLYPQLLNRMLPEDDYIVKSLLENNPQLHFVALVHFDVLRLLLYRWEKIMPDCMDRILFMPQQPLEKFLWVVKQASIVLGSFRSPNGAITGLTAFSQGQVLLAGYGSHRSSLLAKFYYERMGVEDLIAHSHEEAVQIGQRLLDDPQWKAEKVAKIAENLHKIQNVKKASFQLQDFIVQAYDRAASGLAPEHWEHGDFVD